MATRAKSFTRAIFVLFIAAMIAIPTAFAQERESLGEQKGTPSVTAVPRSMTYQGILKDSGGNPLPNTTVNVTFRVFDDEFIGTMEWDQTVTISTDDDAYFTTGLDNLNIPFDVDYWLELQVIGDPGPMLPRQKMNMSAYAARADSSDHSGYSATSGDANLLDGFDSADFATSGHGHATPDTVNFAFDSDSTDAITDGGVDLADLGQNGAASGQIMKWNGSAWAIANDEAGASGSWVDDGTVIRLETISDSVGIGTTTPTEKLEISGNILVTGKATIGQNNTNTGSYAFVAGYGCSAINSYATVSGGWNNTASGINSSVGGGGNNNTSGSNSTISGGGINIASGILSVISGGGYNTVSGSYSTVGGGGSNTASGDYSAIPGGNSNSVAGINSMAFGREVTLNTNYRVAFFSPSWSGRLGVNRDDNSGGILHPIHVGTSAGNGNGAYLTNGGVWTNTSSKATKENFQRLDSEQLLSAIENMPVELWNYKDSDEKHIGPYAEDFVAAFDVGVIRESDGQRENQYLAAGDVAGVALAGVQELLKENREFRKLIVRLENRISNLENK